jgi:hypothetical protein
MATRPELAVHLEEGRSIVAGTLFRRTPIRGVSPPFFKLLRKADLMG